MERVEPFKIDIPQSLLDDLEQRLRNTRWTYLENARVSYSSLGRKPIQRVEVTTPIRRRSLRQVQLPRFLC